MKKCRFVAALALIAGTISVPAFSAELPGFTRHEDVIYGRKFGTALTLDVFVPTAEANGAGVILVMSGGWYSDHAMVSAGWGAEFLRRGYAVFAVVHGSQPKFALDEIVADMNRAVRFLHHRCSEYGVDPKRLGITGASAGGHLSLMIGTAGEEGDPKARDPVDRESSRVAAVGCFFPPTDLLNWRDPGRTYKDAFAEELAPFQAPFDFTELDPRTKRFVLIADESRQLRLARKLSPITHVSADDPPTLIIHGDADRLVWLQQAEAMRDAMDAAGVVNRLVVKPGAGHGWPDLAGDMATVADWFDRHLGPTAAP